MLDMCVLFYNFLFLLYTVLYFIHVVLRIGNLKLVLILFQYRSVKGGVLLPLDLLFQLISVACNSLKQDLYHILVSTCVRSDALPWFHYRRGYLEASRQQGEQLEESTQTSLSNSNPHRVGYSIFYMTFFFLQFRQSVIFSLFTCLSELLSHRRKLGSVHMHMYFLPSNQSVIVYTFCQIYKCIIFMNRM